MRRGVVCLALSLSLAFAKHKQDMSAEGEITSLQQIHELQFVDVRDDDGSNASCMLEYPSDEFYLMKAGDRVIVRGKEGNRPGSILRCRIVLWERKR